MPIARNPAQHNYHWIPREAETEFQNLLKDGKAYVLPLVGVGGAAELLQKGVGKDENYGLAVGAIRDVGKLAYEFWQRRENQQQQELLQKPEETLLRALAKDFQKHGVILIDTLEQAGKQHLSTRLRFREDGELETPAAEHPRTANLIEYCAGMAHFLFDKPVIMVLAGRPPAIRELGALPLNYFAPTVDVPAFTADEIRTYLESSLPRQIAPPQDSDISKLQQLTLGNPFLLERVVRLLADWQPTWEWKAEQWQPLLNSFQQDERHGLLLYVTQRLLTHVLPDDRAFWRLALPRHSIHRDMAELLFPKDEFGDQSGLQRLRLYEEKGTVYREQDPDRYFLHDETRAAFRAWAKREKVWLDKAACDIHARLASWFGKNSGWPAEYPNPTENIPQNDNPLLLEGAHHNLMADHDFEKRYAGYNRQQFWQALSTSVSVSNALKMKVGVVLPTLSLYQIQELSKVWLDEADNFGKLLTPAAQQWLQTHSHEGTLPSNWDKNEVFLVEAIKTFPHEATFLGNFAYFMHTIRKDYDRAETLFQQAIDADPKHANNLGNFALFMKNIRKDYDRAETLYQQAIDADPKHARNLGNFADFMETKRKDYDRAEALYQQAIDADPKHARNLENFAIFLHLYRKDYPQAKQLYHRALEVEPNKANSMANLAQLYLMEGDITQGKTLIDQAFATNPDAAALKLELWFYRLAHFPQDYPQAEAEIMALLETGERDEGWDFSGNIARAEQDGHPNAALLKALAAAITLRTSDTQTPIL